MKRHIKKLVDDELRLFSASAGTKPAKNPGGTVVPEAEGCA